MEPFSGSGAFYLPGSDRAVRGEFAFDGDSSSISLGDPLVHYVTPVGQALPYEGRDSMEHAVIHGDLDTGELITMLHCRGSQRTALHWFESWRCAVALVGGHAQEDAFTRLSLQFDCLKAWAEPPPVVNDVKIGDDGGAVLDTSRHELERAAVSDAVVTLVAHVQGRWGGDVADVQRRCSLVIETQPCGFGHLADVNRPGSDGGSGYWIPTRDWSVRFVA